MEYKSELIDFEKEDMESKKRMLGSDKVKLAFLNSCSKHLVATIIKGDKERWCSLYIGKEIHVKPFVNSANETVEFLYSVIKCKHNKAILSKDEWNSVKYPNAWGITLSIRKENVDLAVGHRPDRIR